MERDYEFGERTFNRWSKFVRNHTPERISNYLEGLATDPELRRIRNITYGLMAIVGGIAVYGAVSDRPATAIAGAFGAGMLGLVQIARKKVMRSVDEVVDEE